MSEVIEEDMDEEEVKEEFRWWRPRISQKLIEKANYLLEFQQTFEFKIGMYKFENLAMELDTYL